MLVVYQFLFCALVISETIYLVIDYVINQFI